jgi:prophage regulatory protein
MTNEEMILQKLTAIEANLWATKEVFNSIEAAAFLDIELAYLYKLTHSNTIPFSKPNGKKIYFSKQDLIKWALSNRNSSREELEQKAATYNAIHKK